MKRIDHPKALSPEDLTMSFQVDGQWYSMPMGMLSRGHGMTNREIVALMTFRGYGWLQEGNFLVLAAEVN